MLKRVGRSTTTIIIRIITQLFIKLPCGRKWFKRQLFIKLPFPSNINNNRKLSQGNYLIAL